VNRYLEEQAELAAYVARLERENKALRGQCELLAKELDRLVKQTIDFYPEAAAQALKSYSEFKGGE